MALTPSNEFAIGTIAPNFELPDTLSGKTLSLGQARGDKGTVIMFICNHCPFVKLINKEIVKLANDFNDKGIKLIAISSNDVDNYPDDSPQKMKLAGIELGYSFPYLYDEDQSVAKAYHAACTPDIYVFDENLACFYHGQLDNARPGSGMECDGQDLRSAIDDLLAATPLKKEMKPSIGCGIKWK